MKEETKQLNEWANEFGNAYIERNQCTEELVQKRTTAFAQMLRPLGFDQPCTILEVGSNIGHNIKALQRINGAELHALEPNPRAREILHTEKILPACQIHEGSAESLPFGDLSMDMVFTCTVLIHVPDETLKKACQEIHRVANKYILVIEYFSPSNEVIKYHGREDMLFKRDYGSVFLELFPELTLLDYGFFWKPLTALDNCNYWLFRK